MEANHINHLRIPIIAHKAADRVNSLAEVARVMSVLRDPSQHPVLVHCNKGKVMIDLPLYLALPNFFSTKEVGANEMITAPYWMHDRRLPQT